MRKQTVWIYSLVLLLAPFAAAQDAARNAYDKLVENFVAAKLARSEQSARIQQSDAYKDAVAAGDYTASQALLADLPNPEATFKPMFEAASERFAESPDEALFLGWLLENVRPPRGKASDYALQLVERHAKHEIWKTLVPNAPYYFGSDPAPQLAKLGAESPFDEVQTWLRYANTQSVLRSKQSSDAAKAAAKVEQQSILREQPDSIPALQIAGPEFKESRLQIGMVAPEIEGPDLDGQTFKLSDYRGKVVVLDFWGDW